MGIKDLFKLIKTNAPNELLDFHLHEFMGWRLPIDISIFLNKFIKSAGDRLWQNTFFYFYAL